MKRFRAILMFFALFLAALLPQNGVFALAEESSPGTVKPVRIAISTGSAGLEGYLFEFVQEISQYTEWRYEFVDYGGAPDVDQQILEDLKNGEIDIAGGLPYNASTAQEFGFGYSSHSYATRYAALQTLLSADTDITFNSQIDQHFKIAMTAEGDSLKAELDRYCASYRVTYERVQCANSDAQIAALQRGDADLMLGESLVNTECVRTIAKFAARPLYFLVSNHSDVLKELDTAMNGIEQATPDFENTLYEKYFVCQRTELEFSAEEKAYANRAPVRVGILRAQAPYQYARGGNAKGINVDVLDYVATKAGLELRYVFVDTASELYGLAERCEVELIAGMPYNYDLARDKNLSMTRVFVSVPYMLLMNRAVSETELAGKRLAQPKTETYAQALVENTLYYDTLEQCIVAVDQGIADYTYADTYVVQYYLNRSGYGNLKLVPQTREPSLVSFGVVKNNNAPLLSICNKVIRSVPEAEMQAIINNNIFWTGKHTFAMLIRDNPVGFVLIVMGIVVVLIAVAAVLVGYRTRRNKERKIELSKLHRVLALANESFFEFDYKKKQLTISTPDRESGTADIAQYTLGENSGDLAKDESQSRLLQLLHSERNTETLYIMDKGVYHWFRFTVERVYDAGAPLFAIGKFANADEEMVRETELAERVRLDSLTGILNAGAIRECVADDIIARTGGQGALILVDVDHFKSVNDTFGHLEGDRTLQKVADLLKTNYEHLGYVGRPGGDEFLIYLKNVASSEDLESTLIDLCALAHTLRYGDGKTVTFSIGAVMTDSKRYDDLYQRADNALYAAKRAGRNRYRIAARGGVRLSKVKNKTSAIK